MAGSPRSMRKADANEKSGKLGSAFGGSLVGVSQLRITLSDPLIDHYSSSSIGRSWVS